MQRNAGYFIFNGWNSGSLSRVRFVSPWWKLSFLVPSIKEKCLLWYIIPTGLLCQLEVCELWSDDYFSVSRTLSACFNSGRPVCFKEDQAAALPETKTKSYRGLQNLLVNPGQEFSTHTHNKTFCSHSSSIEYFAIIVSHCHLVVSLFHVHQT